MAKQQRLTFLKSEHLVKDIYLFSFTTPEGFSFTAGQYLQISLPHEQVDEKGSSRFFTISSAPYEKQIQITTTKSNSTFKKKLFGLQKGDTVAAFGPIGTFVLSGD